MFITVEVDGVRDGESEQVAIEFCRAGYVDNIDAEMPEPPDFEGPLEAQSTDIESGVYLGIIHKQFSSACETWIFMSGFSCRRIMTQRQVR
jgi:hypothetical protein